MKYLCFIVIILSVISCHKLEECDCMGREVFPETNLIDEQISKKISDKICNTLNEKELVGIQVAITDSLGETFLISAGNTNLDRIEKIHNDHIFRIGSVTKIYTSTLILKLAEKGLLELNKDISHYYPDFDNAKKITIRQLLNHSSGLKDIFDFPDVFISSTKYPTKTWNPEEIALKCLSNKLLFDPGSETRYSSAGFILLGKIAEKVTGKKVHELYDETILSPLNLNNTYLVPEQQNPTNMLSGFVHHFVTLSEWYENTPSNTSWSSCAFTSGALISNASDVSKFMHHLFQGNIISKKMIEEMTSFKYKNGLGIFKYNLNGNEYYGHEGEIVGFECITAYNPEKKISIALCCNSTPFKIYSLLSEIEFLINKK